MGTIDISRLYLDGEVLFASDLDAIIDAIELFINTTKLNDDNIANGGITGSLKLVNASVTNAKLAADSIGTTNIAASAVTSAKILDDAVTTAKILDDAVTNDKLAADSIDSDQIVDGSVTRVKLANPNYNISTSHSGSFSTTAGTATAVTNCSATLTLTGRPVLIGAMSGGLSKIRMYHSTYTGTALTTEFYLYKAGAKIATIDFTAQSYNSGTFVGFYTSPCALQFIDTAGTTGSTTYDLRVAVTAGSATLEVFQVKLYAVEL